MNPWLRALLQIGVLAGAIFLLVKLFPGAYRFAEMAARDLRYFWWVILLVALGGWLIWGIGRGPKK